jgi:hypothetical protein
MKFVKSILMGTGAVVLAGLILTLLAPKAAHAIVATAVSVVNTAAAPAVTQDVGKLAGQAVQVWCPFSVIGCYPFPTFSGPAYTVPAGHSLMVTSVDFVWEGAGGTPASNFYALYCGPIFSSTSEVGEWFLPGGTSPSQFVYPSGYKISGGCDIGIVFPTTDTYDVILRGYLTTN